MMAAVLALWAIPWVPFGTTPDDHTCAVWVALVLAGRSALVRFFALFTRESASTEEDVPEFRRGVLGKGARLGCDRRFAHGLAWDSRADVESPAAPLGLHLARLFPPSHLEIQPIGRYTALERLRRYNKRGTSRQPHRSCNLI